ncbi:NADH-quinone oxidoreductase subunit NuoG [Symbiobacterium terraclitae]|uniref:NADH-quinone oxidoreductase subunit NuoG n=1 Tax=Symbiobacterium terraclitae TaxID=557451 RepID=UPI0035B54D4A
MSEQQLVTVTIDGRTARVPKGTLLVEAAKTVGIEIPVFCYHPKLDPAGVCRMCLVQIEKIPKPQPACTTPVTDGMVVHTQTDRVAELRRGVLEFLLLNHPLDCPVCDKGGECDLQDLTFAHGPSTSRLLDGKIRKNKAVELGNFIVLDNERCILCRRCVRFDEEVATEGNLIIEERGHLNTVTTMEGQEYNSYFSGNTIELCPVGALTSELYRFKARPWDLSKAPSVCTGCSVGCNVNLEFRHGQLLRLTNRENPEIDNGWLCDRGRFNYRFAQAEARITRPMVKRDGQFVPVTWAEAFAVIAERFKAVAAEKGGKGFGVIGGGKLTNEEAYLLSKFARLALKTNNIDHRVTGQVVASVGTFPGRQADLSSAQAILVVDVDPAETAPVMDLRIRRMADRKLAKIALIGSVLPKYRGRHARIQLKPGETAGVLRALAAVVGGAKPAASGADPETLKEMAALIGGGKRVAVVWSGENAETGRALLELAAALKSAGNPVSILVPGAQNNSRGAEAMGVLPGYLPGFNSASDSRGRDAVAGAWTTRSLPAEAGLDTAGMLKAAAEGQIDALYLAGANLMNTYPDRNLVQAALEKAFVVAADLFMNETVALADVVLPAATLGEKTGSYTALDGAVQTVKAAKRLEGQAQPDGDILVGLAAALGVKIASSPAATAAEIARLVGKLEEGTVLKGAPVSLLQGAAAESEPARAAGENELWLVPVDRLYAGGSTAQFDAEFNHVLPKAAALFNPADAARLGIAEGDRVELAAGEAKLALTASVDKRVVAGTVQAIRRLSTAPVNALTRGSAPVAVSVAKLAVEVAD